MPDSLEARVRAVRLTEAEQRVVDYLLAHPRQAILASAGQIAEGAGTSDATVVRTARTLGFAGLPELRQSLTDRVVGATGPAAQVRRVAADSSAGLLERVFEEAAERLARTAAAVDGAAFDAAVALLAEAGEVVGYGLGPSELVARALALRLTRIGRRARATGAVGFRLADDLVGLGPDAVVVLYLPARRTVDAEVVLDHVRAVGARSVLVTDALGGAFGDRADVVLDAVHGLGDVTGEGLTAAVLTDALCLAVAARDERSVVAADETLTRLRADLSRDAPRRR
ncbi:MurR/RpiR family transcriptional regulator [Pseudonocardia halophobica]|uniref:MurR/RpiR family transcriptional regulator n=1 Tax=Pseudonocardia halophobica TaxID=29401 RepID=UPI003D8D5265